MNPRRGHTITKAQCDRRKNFGELVTRQSILLRRAKEGKSIVPFVEAIPYAWWCAACGVRPAAKYVDEPDPRYLCRVCTHKFGPDERRGRKSLWARRFEDDYLRQNFEIANKYLLAELDYDDIQVAMDLSEIASAANGRARGYVGIIYADGNEIRHQIEASARLAKYKEKSLRYYALKSPGPCTKHWESTSKYKRMSVAKSGVDALSL